MITINNKSYWYNFLLSVLVLLGLKVYGVIYWSSNYTVPDPVGHKLLYSNIASVILILFLWFKFYRVAHFLTFVLAPFLGVLMIISLVIIPLRSEISNTVILSPIPIQSNESLLLWSIVIINIWIALSHILVRKSV